MSACTAECEHPGRPSKRPSPCPDCGRFSTHPWSWETYSPDGYYVTWGGVCGVHGDWRESN